MSNLVGWIILIALLAHYLDLARLALGDRAEAIRLREQLDALDEDIGKHWGRE